MKAINKTKNVSIAEDVRIANNPFTRMVGLLLDSYLPQNCGLVIEPGKQIHSFFMRFTFDALFIDKNGIVVHLIENMKPWGASKLVLKSRKVFELPAGTIEKTGTEVGDEIEFIQI